MRCSPRGIVIYTERNTTINIRRPVCLRRAERGSITTFSTEKQTGELGADVFPRATIEIGWGGHTGKLYTICSDRHG